MGRVRGRDREKRRGECERRLRWVLASVQCKLKIENEVSCTRGVSVFVVFGRET